MSPCYDHRDGDGYKALRVHHRRLENLVESWLARMPLAFREAYQIERDRYAKDIRDVDAGRYKR